MGNHNPEGAEMGLDLFAAAWLEMWTAKGGYVSIGDDGKSWIGHPADAPTRELAANLPFEVRERNRTFDDGHYVGAMRSLCDLLDMVPGGRAAVKAHVRLHPHYVTAGGGCGWPGGAVMIEFLDDIFTATVKDGVVHCEWPDGKKVCMSLRIFRMQHARNARMLAEHDASGSVVPMMPTKMAKHSKLKGRNAKD